MPRYVALLRGINVGGHTVKMDRLKALVEGLRVKNVETFIASGNVVFETSATDAPALERRIERRLGQALGFAVATFLRTDRQLAEVLEHDVLQDLGAHAVYIGFLREPPSREVQAKLMRHDSRSDSFHVSGREVYWLCRTPRMSDSPFFKVGLEKALGVTATVRNATTVAKLVEKYPWTH